MGQNGFHGDRTLRLRRSLMVVSIALGLTWSCLVAAGRTQEVWRTRPGSESLAVNNRGGHPSFGFTLQQLDVSGYRSVRILVGVRRDAAHGVIFRLTHVGANGELLASLDEFKIEPGTGANREYHLPGTQVRVSVDTNGPSKDGTVGVDVIVYGEPYE